MTTIILTSGTDFFTGGNSADQIFGAGGDDFLNGAGGNDTLFGGWGNDLLTGGQGNDFLYGGEGNDTANYVFASTGISANLLINQVRVGSSEIDYLSSIENVSGSAYGDTMIGNAADNTFTGNGGNDYLSGGLGNDMLYGGVGNDYLIGGAGADHHDGSTGIDAIDFQESAAGVTVNLSTGLGSGGDAEGDTYIGIEDVYGSAFDDIITGNNLANTLVGGNGNNTISGGRGNDTLMGGDDDDTINGGLENDTIIATKGHDVMNGGSGFDTVIYTGSDAGISIDLEAHTANGGFAEDHELSGIEKIIASSFNDHLFGSIYAETFYGGAGNDELSGRGGTDTLAGQHGNDTISGGDGNDIIIGGVGRDVMRGDAGADRFEFDTISDSGTTSATRDVIQDFEQGLDTLDFSAFDGRPGTGMPGHQPLDFLGTDPFSGTLGHAELRVRYENGNTIVEIDANYDAVADFSVRLNGIHDLTLDDFVL